MSEYKCGDCGREFSFEEHRRLDRAPVDPTDPDRREGYVTVCECGYRFFEDGWNEVTVLTHDGTEFRVSTVFLNLNHGFRGEDRWYETCVFWDTGSNVVERYETKDEAKTGHERIVEMLRCGEYEKQDVQFSTLSFPSEEVSR